MKTFSLALGILWVVGTSQAMPQYGQVPAEPSGPGPKTPTNEPQTQTLPPPKLPEGCRIEYQDFHSIIHIETNEEVCTPYTENVCETKYREACTDYEDEECRTEYKSECETKYNEECSNLSRDVIEPYWEEECNDELTKVCEFHWVVYDGEKVWEEDPETCKELPQTKCEQVRKTRTKQEPYTECNDVPYQDCRDVPYQECEKVIKQDCQQVPYDDCKDVTKTNCKNVHKRVPQQQTERREVTVCDGGDDVVVKSDDEINQIIKDGTRSGSFDSEEEEEKEETESVSFTFSK